jgi:hypothetical protein
MAMRSYIFTAKERKAIHAFLRGELPKTDHFLSQIRTRLKQFARLREDVDLYVRLSEAISTAST